MMGMTKEKTFNGVPLSVLDLAPVTEGSQVRDAFKNSVDLAQHVEKWGFKRFWLAEHHNMPGIASSATSVLMGHIAEKTNHIRIGAGGVMLPNHAPLVVAEQFGTLETLYPNRIDLGLGRAPGTDQLTAIALRRTLNSHVNDFPEQVEELQGYFSHNPSAPVRAIPGEGLQIPIWLLGSSDYSARLAAEKGLPFSFASHFSAEYTLPALHIYHQHFQPSDVLTEPYTMVAVNIIAAETTKEAQYLATSMQQQYLSLQRGENTKLQPPIDNLEEKWSYHERIVMEKTLQSDATIVGNPKEVKEKLHRFIEQTKANEVIIHSQIYSHADRLKSYEIVADLME